MHRRQRLHSLDNLDGAIPAMTMRGPSLVLLLASAGCSSSAGTSSPGGGYSGGASGWAGASGSGGSSAIISLDAAAAAWDAKAPSGDANGQSQVPNLSTDAPTFNWDTRTCTSCPGSGGGAGTGVGGATGGGVGGATGTSTASGGRISGSGGAIGSGGIASGGGSSGRGGSSGGGGGPSMDAPGSPVDSGAAADAFPDSGLKRDTGLPPDAMPDLGAPDLVGPDSTTRCVAQIRSLIPSTDALDQFPLVAGANTQVVLRAEIVSGGPTTAPTWYWQGYRDNVPLTATAHGTLDPAAVAFPIATDGTYTFTATEGASPCMASVRVAAVPSNACPACDRSVILRAAPPPDGLIPVQSGAIGLAGGAPFSQTNVVLAQGVSIAISPSVGSNLVPAYVRISNPAGDLVADGLADPKARFGALLLAMDNNLALLRYDVLVVPINDTNGGAVAATAPQLFQSLTPDQINASGFGLYGGVNVSGSTTTSSSTPVSDTRVILTNRNPTAQAQASDLIFSSVGRTQSDGNFVLQVQTGKYWVSISPPPGSGLAEALAPAAVDFQGPANISFQWSPIALGSLTLTVRDFYNAPVDGARVRLTSSQATAVGTLTVTGSVGEGGSQTAQGNVRVEGTTSAGNVTFTNLPVNTTYDALIVPPALGPYTATTLLTVAVSGGATTQTVKLLSQGRINGKLLSGAAAAPDWTKVSLVAYDRSTDTPESPQVVSANADGSFSIGASPGRPYVVIAVPAAGSGLARTFVGPGPLESSEFTITQRVQGSMDWMATVMDENQRGLGGTALQVFCGASWPNCVDATIPLAETTSEASGAFQLALPNPATR